MRSGLFPGRPGSGIRRIGAWREYNRNNTGPVPLSPDLRNSFELYHPTLPRSK